MRVENGGVFQIAILVIGLTQLSFCRDGTLPSATRRGSCSGAQCAPRSRVRGSTCVGTSIARPRLRSKQSPGRAIQPGPLSRLGWICLRQIAFVPNAGRAMLVPTVCLLMKADYQNRHLKKDAKMRSFPFYRANSSLRKRKRQQSFSAISSSFKWKFERYIHFQLSIFNF